MAFYTARRMLPRLLILLFLAPGWIWAAGVWRFLLPGPDLLGKGAALLWMSLLLPFFPLARRRRLQMQGGAILATALLWASASPTGEGPWRPEQSRLPGAELQPEGRIALKDLRAFRWPDEATPEAGWRNLEVHLDSLQSMDYYLVYFAETKAVAHAMLSFGFAGGERVCLSIEARRGPNVPYAVLPGMYRQFELMYVLADELDLVALRLLAQGDPIYRFPVKTPREKMQGLFMELLHQANRLKEEPRFYHTIHSSCTTQIAWLVNSQRKEPLNLWDWRLLLPGYSAEMAQEVGLLDLPEALPEGLEAYRLSREGVATDNARAFSQSIRRSSVRKAIGP